MNKIRRLELIQRSLGIRHKIKVHESMKAPDNHEELALALLSKWELEDELNAIEEVLSEERRSNIQGKKMALKQGDSCASIRGRAASVTLTSKTRPSKLPAPPVRTRTSFRKLSEQN